MTDAPLTVAASTDCAQPETPEQLVRWASTSAGSDINFALHEYAYCRLWHEGCDHRFARQLAERARQRAHAAVDTAVNTFLVDLAAGMYGGDRS